MPGAPTQIRTQQQMFMQPVQSQPMFMPENPFPRVDAMYGMGFNAYPNYMMPMQQFPVMQMVPQFQDQQQFQNMGKSKSGKSGDMMQMDMNNYAYQGGLDDEELESSFKGNQQHKGHGKQNQMKNQNNRANNRGNNESNPNNNGGGNNNRRKSNNQGKGQQNNPSGGNVRKNVDSENFEETGEQNNKKNEQKQGSNKQNKREENRTSSQQTGGPVDGQEDELEKLIEQACTLSKDQTGCRKLQKKLETEDQTVITRIFEAILPNFGELMVDPFGNYLCQKVVETCTSEQVGIVINRVTPELISVCLNPHGTRAVQKLIEICAEKDSMLKQITTALSADVVGLVKVNL